MHGAWGGGWAWTAVADELRASGHRVYTPTLTGLGERAHLPVALVGLAVHMADVLAVLEFEDLTDVVLCAAGYGGMPATWAADAAAARVRRLVYVDALVPKDGQAAVDLVPDDLRRVIRRRVTEYGSGARVPVPEANLPPRGWVSNEVWEGYVARLVDHPVSCFTEPVRLTGAVDLLPKAFIRCIETGDDDPVSPHAARAKASGWAYRELSAPHDPQLTDPSATAEVLRDAARPGEHPGQARYGAENRKTGEHP